MNAEASTAAQGSSPAGKRVLNAGSGPYSLKKLHPVFHGEEWTQVRLDINPQVKPDLIGSVTDLRTIIPDGCFDAVWSSHNIEHLHAHEVRPALNEFRRILKADGFALITCPDLEAVARLVVEGKLEVTAYTAPAGPITALDMLFGFGASIERGNTFMAHNTGFTRERLGNLLLACGFAEAWVTRGRMYDLWAVALMPEVNSTELRKRFEATGPDFGSVNETQLEDAAASAAGA